MVGALHSTGDGGPVNVSMCTVDARGNGTVTEGEVRSVVGGAVDRDIAALDAVVVVLVTVVDVDAREDVLGARLLTA